MDEQLIPEMKDFVIDEYNVLQFMGDAPETDEQGLRISLAKWLIITTKMLGKLPSHAGIADHGTWTCGLCMLHYDDDCAYCPIMENVGETFCDNTPYKDWYRETNPLTATEVAIREAEFLLHLPILGAPNAVLTPEEAEAVTDYLENARIELIKFVNR